MVSKTYNSYTKLGIIVEMLTEKMKRLRMKDTNKRAHGKLRLLTFTEVLASKKRMHVCEHVVKMAPCALSFHGKNFHFCSYFCVIPFAHGLI